MLPEIILHNSISLDGSLTGFEPDMETHYRIAGDYGAKVHLIGSNTAVRGFELFGGPPPEEKKDMKRPEGRDEFPYWVVPDTRGKLKGVLHGLRSFEFCRDVIVLVSESTSSDYLDYLRERDYIHHIVGDDHVDIKEAMELLNLDHHVSKVLCDTGRILGNILLEKGLVSEVSLLVHPIIVGRSSYNMFGEIQDVLGMKLLKSEIFENGCIWTVYGSGE